MLQNPHYDASNTKLLKSKHFTQFPTPKHTQSAVISLVIYCALWPQKTVNKHSCLYFNYHVSNSSLERKAV